MDENKYNIAVIGLGYVGLPLAIQFSKKYNVVGLDLDKERISELKNGIDRTNELSDHDLSLLKSIKLTSDKSSIRKSDIYIITVPTPVDKNNKPNLNPLISASKMVGDNISKDNLIIYESTVFPGCTEQVCVPLLESRSTLKYNIDFFCGYSPERINPGDKNYTLTKIIKVVSGSNKKTLGKISSLYKSIIKAGVYEASSIAVAEAAKVIENTQRDVNIALVNELALIFDKLNINTKEVLDAASTKWNFLPFKPGLVGGHCIGVDPYYLTHKAIEVGYHPEIILAGRRINDNMGNFIAEKTISKLVKAGVNPIDAKISILGLSFKENCPDLRNTKVVSIVDRLKHYNCNINIIDHWVMPEEANRQYNLRIIDISSVSNQDAIILAVAHNQYLDIPLSKWRNLLSKNGLIVDIKSLYSKEFFSGTDLKHWRL